VFGLMGTIIYTCPYVPAEWIAAHGLRPSRVIPDSESSVFTPAGREGVCPYVRGFVAEVTKNDRAAGVVVTTVCDQMRRAFDIVARRCGLPSFLMNVPNTWESAAAQELYTDELRRLGRFLVRQGGEAPSHDRLTSVMVKYEMARTVILAEREFFSAREFAEKVAAFAQSGPEVAAKNSRGTVLPVVGVPLAIIGGPMMRQEFRIFDVVEDAGGRIVLDATETGERGMRAPVDAEGLHEDPLRKLAEAYFSGIADASRRPDSELYFWLERRLTERAVRGVIFRRYVWCDMWHAQLRRLKELIELPVLDIDATGDFKNEQNRISGRIRAFLEILR
jgi:benzoyl-CoA reductase/2-hydroxyglutaryl-CoA dehydratase subunit BcrC/BadD/HgdB